LTIRVVRDDAVGPNKARKSTYFPHSEQHQSALPDRFDGAQGQQRGVAVAVWTISFVVLQIQNSSLAVGYTGPRHVLLPS